MGARGTSPQKYRYAVAPTSQFYFCGVPFRLDTTPKCAMDCLYCFAMAKGGRRTVADLIASPAKVRQQLREAFGNGKPDVVREFMRQRVPIHFGGMSDPFASRYVSETSFELMRLLAEYEYPVIISTKNPPKLTEDQGLALVKRANRVVVQVSIATLDEPLARALEPGAPPPSARLRAIAALTREGIPVIARLQPLLPTLLKETAGELIPALAAAGARHLVLEFLKLPVESNLGAVGELFSILRWDGTQHYRQANGVLVGREWLLPTEHRWQEVQPILIAARRLGLTVGLADYGLYHLGDTACCCGIDRIPGFSGWFRANFPSAIRASDSPVVRFCDVAGAWAPSGSMRMFLNSHCRAPGASAALDYLRLKWNQPGSTNAPDSLLGVTWSREKDEAGDCIYTVDRPLPSAGRTGVDYAERHQ